jgi:hypothetical protein
MNTPKDDTASVCQLSDHRPTTKDMMLFVVMVRRNIRRTVAILDSQCDKASQYRRQARVLKARASPFDAARIAALEKMADDVTAACKPLRESLKACGKLLADAAPMIDTGTALAQRCEILNVNAADRGDLTEADGLHQIVFAHGLEDSAARRDRDWNDGPLFQASQQVFMEFLKTREGQKLGDSLFQPGGMFAGLPMYTQAADGTMKRQPPRLYVVPDARIGAMGE